MAAVAQQQSRDGGAVGALLVLCWCFAGALLMLVRQMPAAKAMVVVEVLPAPGQVHDKLFVENFAVVLASFQNAKPDRKTNGRMNSEKG